jgi:hypothetical protein
VIRRIGLGLLLLLCLAFATEARAASQTSLPTGVVTPIPVRLSFRLLNITRLQETLSEVGASIEYTLRWTDPALAFDRVAKGQEHIDYVGPDAEAQLGRIWTPDVTIDNQITNPRTQSLAVSIFYDGRVVMIRRIDADFREQIDMSDFPFDRQELLFNFASRRHAADEVMMSSTEFDRTFSTVPPSVAQINWKPRFINLDSGSFYGWNAQPFSGVMWYLAWASQYRAPGVAGCVYFAARLQVLGGSDRRCAASRHVQRGGGAPVPEMSEVLAASPVDIRSTMRQSWTTGGAPDTSVR